MFKEYLDYLKDNPQGYWFKRKLYGWGWTPVKWQGWAVILGYIALLLGLALTVEKDSQVRDLVFPFFLPLIILTIALLTICYKKGEKPRWSWGIPKKDTE